MSVISKTQTVIEGQDITDTLWNNEFDNIIDNGLIPTGIEDYSSTNAEMQTATDPYPSAAISRPTALSGEIERLRYQVLQLLKAMDNSKTYWYEDAPTSGILTVDSSNSRVGVNNTSPQKEFTVDGVARLRNSTSSRYRVDIDPTNGTGVNVTAYDDTGAVYQTFSVVSDVFRVNINNVEKFRVHSDGKVGIGETTPGAVLDVNGDIILQNGGAVDEFSTDGTMAGDSDTAVPTEKAVKTYVDTQVAAVENTVTETASAFPDTGTYTVIGTLNVTTAAGETILLLGHATVEINSGAGVYFYLRRTSGTPAMIGSSLVTLYDTGGAPCFLFGTETPGAGTHTYVLAYATAGGSPTATSYNLSSVSLR